jgi:hypothetical protein
MPVGTEAEQRADVGATCGPGTRRRCCRLGGCPATLQRRRLGFQCARQLAPLRRGAGQQRGAERRRGCRGGCRLQ